MTNPTTRPARRRSGLTPAQVRRLMDGEIGHYEDSAEPEADLLLPAPPVPAEKMAPPVTTGGGSLRAKSMSAQPERAERLRNFRPKIALSILREIREAVAGQISLVPFVSIRSDNTMCSILYRFAEYVAIQTGHFDPDEHMSDRWIQHYLHDRQSELKTSSQSTIRSALIKIRAGSPDKPRRRKIGRKVAQKPYTVGEWAALRRRVRELLDDTLREDLTMLLDLSGELGLRPTELIYATGQWITSVDGITVVRVPDKNGEYRDVPAFGLVGERLAEYQQSKAWLFAPRLADRRNAVSRIKIRAAAQPGLDDVNPMRARNHWLAELATRRVPSTVVWAVAGLKPGTHTIGDILPHTQQPDSRDILRHLAYVRDNH